METAILPVRYEIENTETTADSSTLKQICSTVISEGGYEQTVQEYYCKKQLQHMEVFQLHFLPLVSIRLKSTACRCCCHY
jgi:hypothetical protein